MAGGPALCAQTLAFGVAPNAKALQRGSARLLAALQQARPVFLVSIMFSKLFSVTPEAPRLPETEDAEQAGIL